MKYIRELHKVCDRVPSVSPQIGKDNRHFIGIITMINERMYAIPITRHDGKPSKRKTLANNEGYTKVTDEKGRFISGINFIDMIPVTEQQLLPMDDYTIKRNDSRLEKDRKRDLRYIYEYITDEQHSRDISNKARVLYNKYISKEPFKRREYCLPFDKLEDICDKYNQK
jgi:protein AbiQ